MTTMLKLVLIISRVHSVRNNYTVSQKRDPNIIDCNFKKD